MVSISTLQMNFRKRILKKGLFCKWFSYILPTTHCRPKNHTYRGLLQLPNTTLTTVLLILHWPEFPSIYRKEMMLVVLPPQAYTTNICHMNHEQSLYGYRQDHWIYRCMHSPTMAVELVSASEREYQEC